jgi:hypothetical protein
VHVDVHACVSDHGRLRWSPGCVNEMTGADVGGSPVGEESGRGLQGHVALVDEPCLSRMRHSERSLSSESEGTGPHRHTPVRFGPFAESGLAKD